MATVTNSLTKSEPVSQIRALNPRTDLTYVADLIELCFAESLDPDGKRYLRRMRRAGSHHKGRWFDLPPIYFNLTAEGFVWEEGEEIVGNISLIPFSNIGPPIYLIANVAVHPDHRRQGIARALTIAALDHIKNRPIRSIWLQVRDNNISAVRLYESLGFFERARRTTWTITPGEFKFPSPTGAKIIQQKSRHWKIQRKWLRKNYPDNLFWYWPFSPNIFRPGFWGMLASVYYETRVRHWAVEQEGNLRGILSWKTTSSYADQLWLAAQPEYDEFALKSLLPNIGWPERQQRPLSLDFPVNRAANILSDVGFQPDHTLIWMEK